MKKKKTQEASQPSSTPDLKALIHDHSLFFDRLVDLIPPRFYLSSNDGEDRPWYPGLSKSQRAAAKKQTKENTKKSRRARLDPSKSSSTLDLLKEKVFEEDNEGEDKVPTAPNRSVTYEELRERLHKRLEELRSTRNTRPSFHPKKDRNSKRKRELGDGQETEKSRDKKNPDENGGKDSDPADLSSGKVKLGDEDESRGKRRKKLSKVLESEKSKNKNPDKNEGKDSDPVDLSFGKVKLGDEDESRGKRKKKKLSKVQELERVKMLQEMKKDPEKGDLVTKKHSWKAAVERAAGLKVHDDPKMLKESLKKEKKKRQKSAQKWKERIESRDKLLADKQKKRSENIKERIHQTKLKKIEKREKKLMRPGFEGRREGFANAPSG